MCLGIRLAVVAEGFHGRAETDCGKHVGDAPPRWHMVAHATRCDQRRADRGQPVQARLIVTAAAMIHGAEQRQGEMASQGLRIGAQPPGKVGVGTWRRNARHHAAFHAGDEHITRQPRLALLAMHAGFRQQAAESPPGRTIGRPGEVLRVFKAKADARHEAYASLLGRNHAAHQPGNGVAIGNADGLHA